MTGQERDGISFVWHSRATATPWRDLAVRDQKGGGGVEASADPGTKVEDFFMPVATIVLASVCLGRPEGQQGSERDV